ncbi:Pr6Pr family membrane protein [Microbacterium sp. TPU 3598]|uniref:Pr6Pr family membrane protein n=1 Tax=Microbacterium sp. TPU 3598 TaxID=1938334 RepID=UPI0012FE45E9|nr:Pr6Pr family membrane protein [Microbacterium sp. TPU 3598]
MSVPAKVFEESAVDEEAVPPSIRWAAARATVAALTLSALGTQLIYELDKRAALDASVVVGNFLGTFTYLSSIIMVFVLAQASYAALHGRTSTGSGRLFVACAANVAFVGIFYNLALRQTMPPDSITWVNETVHVVLPVYAVVDAVFARRNRVPISAGWAAGVLGVLWTVATQLRGTMVSNPDDTSQGWYPYAFVNPSDVPGGLFGAVGVSLVLTGLIVAIGFLLRSLSNRLRTRRGLRVLGRSQGTRDSS